VKLKSDVLALNVLTTRDNASVNVVHVTRTVRSFSLDSVQHEIQHLLLIPIPKKTIKTYGRQTRKRITCLTHLCTHVRLGLKSIIFCSCSTLGRDVNLAPYLGDLISP
ncbi:unnamed protein product, partial [Laminaria digitata]